MYNHFEPWTMSLRSGVALAPENFLKSRALETIFGYRALEHSHELLRVTWERVEELLE